MRYSFRHDKQVKEFYDKFQEQMPGLSLEDVTAILRDYHRELQGDFWLYYNYARNRTQPNNLTIPYLDLGNFVMYIDKATEIYNNDKKYNINDFNDNSYDLRNAKTSLHQQCTGTCNQSANHRLPLR